MFEYFICIFSKEFSENFKKILLLSRKKMNQVNPNQVYTLSDLSQRSNQMKLNSLNGVTPIVVEKDVVVTEVPVTKTVTSGSAWGGLTWFIIIALVVGLLFFLFRPSVVLSTNTATGDLYLDWGKLILWSLVIALIVVLIIWLARGTTGMYF
jgi:hypothetical protein